VAIDTGRSQALVGYVNEQPKKLRNLAASVTNPFASIVLSSLDSKPIGKSSRLLLTAGVRVVNTGMKWNETRTALASWGGPPTMIEPVAGKLILQNIEGALEVRVAALDGAGRRIGEPRLANRTKQGWELEIGEPASTWFEVTVKR